ncbi:MAG: bacillithiol biosynthesis BshC, partial [Candidatus Aminicenantes bacterium]|nr:bacillithiol biosynthesis BshC [Candidatus Aminicenantes bacterium]
MPTKQLPNISPLVYDYFYAFDKVDEYYNGNFRNLTAIQKVAEEVKSRDLKREDVASVLEEQNKNYGCGTETLSNIQKLGQADVCAVVTGQQVGLFSGPLYTIHKSLTAIKLAEYLNQKCAGGFVPVFWLASDDHDLAEIDHIKLLNKDSNIEKIHYQAQVPNSKIPASKILFDSDISRSIHCLEDLTHDSEF